MAVINIVSNEDLIHSLDEYFEKRVKTLSERIEKIADRIENIAPFDKEKNSNSAEIFDGYKWPKEGATRSEIEAWLKETTGKTSNRSMQSIINNALEDGVIHKDLGTHKYHPGKSKASA